MSTANARELATQLKDWSATQAHTGNCHYLGGPDHNPCSCWKGAVLAQTTAIIAELGEPEDTKPKHGFIDGRKHRHHWVRFATYHNADGHIEEWLCADHRCNGRWRTRIDDQPGHNHRWQTVLTTPEYQELRCSGCEAVWIDKGVTIAERVDQIEIRVEDLLTRVQTIIDKEQQQP